MITFGSVVVGVTYVGGCQRPFFNENGDALARTSETAATATVRTIFKRRY